MNRLIPVAFVFAFLAGAAHAQGTDFPALDRDGSGGLSLQEVQAAIPDATEEDFAKYDADGSGELSEAEFSAWVAKRGR
ncbi:EF-hand domain-containing protein [Amphiplicatus metriothermophilus]|uniref:EF hand n=1 Tax=Amphiplicatus metriothermophilus TaxID=1519374 RepID=A0A239PJT9_9PROT|nr:EF-hand domain-containing protein [Amphiplicatus metriothermophilus]MBB5517594.1 hypothetical protein [Amphiplicatus metriothermophilus]SNT68072.1 EF hand [Amphiplicatus metriothermophilus]